MSAQEARKQKPIPVTFRLDPDAARTIEALAEKKGLTRSDFIRAVVEKILAPIQDEDASTAAAIAALPPGPRKKAHRAIEIQKQLHELEETRPKVHALSSLFRDGDGAAQDAKTARLKAELAALRKAFEAEVGPAPAAVKTKKKAQELEVCTVGSADEEVFVSDCDLCGEETPVPDAKPGEVVDFNCKKCGGELKTNETHVWPAADGDEPPDDDEDEDEDEDGAPAEGETEDGPDDEDEPVKTDAEKEADLFLKVNALIQKLEPCRQRLSRFDVWFSPLPACWLLRNELKAMAENVAKTDMKRLAELRAMVLRVVKLRGQIGELKAADSEASAPTIKKLEAELEAMAVELREVDAKRKAAAKGSGSSSWF